MSKQKAYHTVLFPFVTASSIIVHIEYTIADVAAESDPPERGKRNPPHPARRR